MTATTSDISVTTRPTQADAQLLLQLATLATQMDLDRGNALLWKHRQDGGLTYEAFKEQYPLGTAESNAVYNVLKWHETIGTLVKQGLLDRGLVRDWIWVPGAWDMCRDIAIGQRAEVGEEAMWENFEALARE
jgi:hypothetical protein